MDLMIDRKPLNMVLPPKFGWHVPVTPRLELPPPGFYATVSDVKFSLTCEVMKSVSFKAKTKE